MGDKQRVKNGTIWVDMTDMLIWRGSFTGVQRVAYEYARRFAAEGARFCAYDVIRDRYFEISLGFIEKKQKSDGLVSGEVVSLRKRLRNVLGSPYYALPERYKKTLRPLVSRTNRAVRYFMSETVDRFKGRPSPYDGFQNAEFSSGDVVALIGAGWNDSRALDRLVNLQLSVGFKIAQHINDILPIYQPQLFADDLPELFETYMQKVIKCADVITVISEATKRDIEAYCRDHKAVNMRIEVVRLGDDVGVVAPVKPTGVVGAEDFIFALGTFEVRKNYILLYQALKLAQLEGRDLPKIVIAGRKGWLSSDVIHQIKHDPYMKDKLVWLNNVSDGELTWLFKHSLFTVFPSLAEGWGLPVVESLRHGKFSLVSGVSSMLEIGEGLVDYFLPYDARECMEKMQYYLADRRYIAANEKVVKHYRVYTWDESYESFKKTIIG